MHITVNGRVQGVFFRRAAADEAASLGVAGFARNLNDGSVEIVAEGPRASLEVLVGWAHTGPRHARVDKIRTEWRLDRAEFVGFEVR